MELVAPAPWSWLPLEDSLSTDYRFPELLSGKVSTRNVKHAGDTSSIPRSGKSPGGGNKLQFILA